MNIAQYKRARTTGLCSHYSIYHDKSCMLPAGHTGDHWNPVLRLPWLNHSPTARPPLGRIQYLVEIDAAGRPLLGSRVMGPPDIHES